jgi:hypothetical protein
MFETPMSAPMSVQPSRGVLAPLWFALGWPARVAEARETRARLAELSEREWQDILPGRERVAGSADAPFDDDPAEREARARAVRAWYGYRRDAKAA